MMKKGIVLGVLGLAVAGAAIYATGVLAYRGDANKTGPNYSPERHEQMESAFENNDYNAWKSLMDGKGRVTQIINEGNFNRFSEMHRLMEEGKTDEADKIRRELGLGQGGRNGQGKDMGNGQKGQNRGENFVDENKDGVCDRMQ